MSPEQLLRLARYLPALVGVGLILVGAYAAGGVETTCTRTDGRVGCRLEDFLRDRSRHRLFLFSSDWPFGLAAGAFGLVWIGIGAVVIRVVNRGG